MTADGRIGSLSIELRCDGDARLINDEAELALRVQTELLQDLEPLFARFEGRDVTLTHLELDLGRYPDPADWTAFRRDVAERIATALVDALDDQLANGAAPLLEGADRDDAPASAKGAGLGQVKSSGAGILHDQYASHAAISGLLKDPSEDLTMLDQAPAAQSGGREGRGSAGTGSHAGEQRNFDDDIEERHAGSVRKGGNSEENPSIANIAGGPRSPPALDQNGLGRAEDTPAEFPARAVGNPRQSSETPNGLYDKSGAPSQSEAAAAAEQIRAIFPPEASLLVEALLRQLPSLADPAGYAQAVCRAVETGGTIAPEALAESYRVKRRQNRTLSVDEAQSAAVHRGDRHDGSHQKKDSPSTADSKVTTPRPSSVATQTTEPSEIVGLSDGRDLVSGTSHAARTVGASKRRVDNTCEEIETAVRQRAPAGRQKRFAEILAVAFSALHSLCSPGQRPAEAGALQDLQHLIRTAQEVADTLDTGFSAEAMAALRQAVERIDLESDGALPSVEALLDALIHNSERLGPMQRALVEAVSPSTASEAQGDELRLLYRKVYRQFSMSDAHHLPRDSSGKVVGKPAADAQGDLDALSARLRSILDAVGTTIVERRDAVIQSCLAVAPALLPQENQTLAPRVGMPEGHAQKDLAESDSRNEDALDSVASLAGAPEAAPDLDQDHQNPDISRQDNAATPLSDFGQPDLKRAQVPASKDPLADPLDGSPQTALEHGRIPPRNSVVQDQTAVPFSAPRSDLAPGEKQDSGNATDSVSSPGLAAPDRGAAAIGAPDAALENGRQAPRGTQPAQRGAEGADDPTTAAEHYPAAEPASTTRVGEPAPVDGDRSAPVPPHHADATTAAHLADAAGPGATARAQVDADQAQKPTLGDLARAFAQEPERLHAIAGLGAEQFDAVTAALDPDWDRREGAALRALRPALAAAEVTMLQRVAIRALLGLMPPAGGISGRVAQAVLAIGGSQTAMTGLAARIAQRLDPRKGPEGPTVLAALQKLAPEVEAGAEASPTNVAGLILLAPFLPTFALRAGLAPEHRPLDRSTLAALLSWVAGKEAILERPPGPLECFLAGLAEDAILAPVTRPAPDIETLIESMLEAICAAWPPLKKSSPDALREGFLRRPGLLEPRPTPRLTVQRATVDILLDRLPWSHSMVVLPWLDAPLPVRWRNTP